MFDRIQMVRFQSSTIYNNAAPVFSRKLPKSLDGRSFQTRMKHLGTGKSQPQRRTVSLRSEIGGLISTFLQQVQTRKRDKARDDRRRYPARGYPGQDVIIHPAASLQNP